ncbi:MAG: hypothetical protein KC422_17885 [Trueperaceae bacterium]|nr:hypothetical protein [Trueperaceae bacterium]
MSYLLYANDFPAQASLMGGKARALAHLSGAGFPIPEWFVVSPKAFDESLSAVLRTKLEGATGADEIWGLLEGLQPAEAIQISLQKALEQLQGERFAVRSSASDEDGVSHSFAGQLESFLFVKAEDVSQRIADVWRSGFSERVLLYRKEAGLSPLPNPPSVLVQHMVNAEKAGVAFGADPVSGRRNWRIISAVYGLGSALVSGEADADTYTVSASLEPLKQSIAHKPSAHFQDDASPEGVNAKSIAQDMQDKPVLSTAQLKDIAQLVAQVNRHFARPQDIEWAIAEGKLYLLQSRAITSLVDVADPEGMLGIWDNSNIVESYGGVTTPLTFSFALYAYEGVYRELLRLLGVPARKRLEQENTFKHMLGFFRGRIYYNLLSWYKLLATVPGFQLNRKFMEQMMGVKESLPEEIVAGLSQQGSKGKDAVNLGLAILKLLNAYRKLPRDVKQFYRRLETALETDAASLNDMRPDELVAHYHKLESRLLRHWDAPLVNDFFAMIFYGVLRSLCERWLRDGESLQNTLISGEGGMISAEPAQRVLELSRMAAEKPHFARILVEGSLHEILREIAAQPAFKEKYEAYLDKFGERCLEELKLESPTLLDDPLLLLRSVGNLAQHPESLKARAEIAESPRILAERQVAEQIKNPVRKLVFNWVLREARARVRDRENLRFERTRLFGHVRRLFLELGGRFYALNWLKDPRDIFYLELNEILALVEGTSTLTHTAALAELRKTEIQSYRQAPSNRFETRGMPYQGHDFQAKTEAKTDLSGDLRQGIGCCPGVIRGRVCVVANPREAQLPVGDILVAKQTDPGWIMLFPAASGLLVERGSLLSHSAIVAREMNIPAVVSVPDLCQWLKTGDFVEFDGRTGVIKKLEAKDEQ